MDGEAPSGTSKRNGRRSSILKVRQTRDFSAEFTQQQPDGKIAKRRVSFHRERTVQHFDKEQLLLNEEPIKEIHETMSSGGGTPSRLQLTGLTDPNASQDMRDVDDTMAMFGSRPSRPAHHVNMTTTTHMDMSICETTVAGDQDATLDFFARERPREETKEQEEKVVKSQPSPALSDSVLEDSGRFFRDGDSDAARALFAGLPSNKGVADMCMCMDMTSQLPRAVSHSPSSQPSSANETLGYFAGARPAAARGGLQSADETMDMFKKSPSQDSADDTLMMMSRPPRSTYATQRPLDTSAMDMSLSTTMNQSAVSGDMDNTCAFFGDKKAKAPTPAQTSAAVNATMCDMDITMETAAKNTSMAMDGNETMNMFSGKAKKGDAPRSGMKPVSLDSSSMDISVLPHSGGDCEETMAMLARPTPTAPSAPANATRPHDTSDMDITCAAVSSAVTAEAETTLEEIEVQRRAANLSNLSMRSGLGLKHGDLGSPLQVVKKKARVSAGGGAAEELLLTATDAGEDTLCVAENGEASMDVEKEGEAVSYEGQEQYTLSTIAEVSSQKERCSQGTYLSDKTRRSSLHSLHIEEESGEGEEEEEKEEQQQQQLREEEEKGTDEEELEQLEDSMNGVSLADKTDVAQKTLQATFNASDGSMVKTLGAEPLASSTTNGDMSVSRINNETINVEATHSTSHDGSMTMNLMDVSAPRAMFASKSPARRSSTHSGHAHDGEESMLMDVTAPKAMFVAKSPSMYRAEAEREAREMGKRSRRRRSSILPVASPAVSSVDESMAADATLRSLETTANSKNALETTANLSIRVSRPTIADVEYLQLSVSCPELLELSVEMRKGVVEWCEEKKNRCVPLLSSFLPTLESTAPEKARAVKKMNPLPLQQSADRYIVEDARKRAETEWMEKRGEWAEEVREYVQELLASVRSDYSNAVDDLSLERQLPDLHNRVADLERMAAEYEDVDIDELDCLVAGVAEMEAAERVGRQREVELKKTKMSAMLAWMERVTADAEAGLVDIKHRKERREQNALVLLRQQRNL